MTNRKRMQARAVLNRVEKPGRYVGGEWNHIDKSESFYKLVLALLITIVLINIAGILSYLHKKRKLDIVNWAIFQSAILILALFADRFPIADRKAFWLGVVAVCALYATTRLSSAWLFKKFDDIEKL